MTDEEFTKKLFEYLDDDALLIFTGISVEQERLLRKYFKEKIAKVI